MRRSARTLFALAFVALGPAACDRSPSGLDSDVEIAEIILVERGTNEVVAYSHRDHWHGVLRLSVDDSAEYTAYFLDEPMGVTDHSLPDPNSWTSLPSADYTLQGTVEDASVATWSGGEEDGRLVALAEGGTHVTFVVLEGGTTIYQAPPVGLSVTP